MRKVLFSILMIGVMTVLGGCDVAYQSPPKTSVPVAIDAKSSTVTLPISLSLDDLQMRLNTAIPNPVYVIDENRDACVPAQWANICVGVSHHGHCYGGKIKTKITPDIDCNLQGAVNRSDIGLSGAANTLSLGMDLDLQVTARGRGDIGKNIRETATGNAHVTAAATLDIGADWLPVADVAADYSWNDRIGVNIMGFRVTFADKVDPKIREAIDTFRASMPDLISTLAIKDRVEKAWQQAFIPVQINKEPPVWLRFSPESVSFSGISIVDRQVSMTISAAGRTETFVGSAPAQLPAAALPELGRSVSEPGFHFNLPIHADYAAIIAAANPALKIGNRQDFEIAGMGNVGVTIKGLDLYQTEGQALAVGVSMKVDTPTDWFDTDGTVWLTAKPLIDNELKQVRLTDLSLFGVAENHLSDALIKVVQFPGITGLIEQAVVYDFANDYDKALAAANAAMTRKISDDLNTTGQLTDVKVDQVNAAPDGLDAVISLTGTAEIHIGGI